MVEPKHYERPDTRRFSPDDFTRSVVQASWIDSDPLARCDIENQPWQEWRIKYTDRHGYPAA